MSSGEELFLTGSCTFDSAVNLPFNGRYTGQKTPLTNQFTHFPFPIAGKIKLLYIWTEKLVYLMKIVEIVSNYRTFLKDFKLTKHYYHAENHYKITLLSMKSDKGFKVVDLDI